MLSVVFHSDTNFLFLYPCENGHCENYPRAICFWLCPIFLYKVWELILTVFLDSGYRVLAHPLIDIQQLMLAGSVVLLVACSTVDNLQCRLISSKWEVELVLCGSFPHLINSMKLCLYMETRLQKLAPELDQQTQQTSLKYKNKLLQFYI